MHVFMRKSEISHYYPFIFFPLLTIPLKVFLSCLLIWMSYNLFSILLLHKILTFFNGGSVMIRKGSKESFTTSFAEDIWAVAAWPVHWLCFLIVLSLLSNQQCNVAKCLLSENMKISLPVKGIASTISLEYYLFGLSTLKKLFCYCYSEGIL